MAIIASHISDQIDADRLARQQRFQRACRWYHGDMPNPLKVRVDQPDDNTKVNLSRVVVDKSVSFLFGKGVEFELDESADTEAEDWLEQAWRANKKQGKLHQLGLNGGIYGHPFVKLVPARPYPRIVILDPSTVDVAWDVEDIEKVIRFVITYAACDPYTMKPVNVRQIVERVSVSSGEDRWTITDQRNDPDGSEDAWVTISVTDWPYAWSPILHCQNLPAPGEFWGVSDLEDDVLSTNHNINFLFSNLMRIIRYHAHPKTWGTGFDPGEVVRMSVDDITVLPPGATLQNLEMQGDIAASLEFYGKLREALHELTRVPEVATGKVENVGALSGVALSILYQPLLEKTETKRQLYGDLLIELCQRMLELGGFGADNIVTLHWPELLPSDMLTERQAYQIDKNDFGVSADTIQEKLGYDPDLEREKNPEIHLEATRAVNDAGDAIPGERVVVK